MTIKFTVGLESDKADPSEEQGLRESSPWLDELARAHERSPLTVTTADADGDSEVRRARAPEGWLLSSTEPEDDPSVIAVWAW